MVPQPDDNVRPAAYESPAAGTVAPAPGERVYYEGSPSDALLGGDFGAACGPGGCGEAGCNHCGRFSGPMCGPFGQGCLGGLYVRGEYLLWGTKGMDLPALVTTSPDGTSQPNAGVLGEDGTDVLFGDESVNSDLRSGGKITVGWWLDPCRRLGIEGDYFVLQDENNGFRQSSSGDTILARPFYDIVDGTENSSLTSFAGLTSGTIAADAETRFRGAGVRTIYNLGCGDGMGTSCITCRPVTTGYRFDAILGYRYLGVDDRLSVVEDATSLDSTASGSFLIRDLFDTENEFHGVDLGTSWSWCKGCFSLDLLGKVAIGNTRSRVRIDGSTIITENGDSEQFSGGILAQRTNIGEHTADEFAMAPELGVTVGYQINPCWRATLGYNFLYWSRVARAGDQIDRDLNPDLLPPEVGQVSTHLRPDFDLHYTDFWAQGMTVGLEGSW